CTPPRPAAIRCPCASPSTPTAWPSGACARTARSNGKALSSTWARRLPANAWASRSSAMADGASTSPSCRSALSRESASAARAAVSNTESLTGRRLSYQEKCHPCARSKVSPMCRLDTAGFARRGEGRSPSLTLELGRRHLVGRHAAEARWPIGELGPEPIDLVAQTAVLGLALRHALGCNRRRLP